MHMPSTGLKMVVLVAVLAVAAGAVVVMADSNESDARGAIGGNLQWEIEGNTLHIWGTGDMRDYSTGLLPYPWFLDDEYKVIEYIKMDEGITSITRGCFDFPNLKGEIVLPKSLKSIGTYVFRDAKITSIVIPEGSQLSSIGMGAFQNCKELTGTLNLPKGLTYLGDHAFQGCEKMKGTLRFSDGLSSIGYYAFQGCSSLTGELRLPADVVLVGGYAFDGCTGITGNVTVPSLFLGFGTCAFRNCTGITGAINGSSNPMCITSMGQSAFEGCTGITSVKLFNGVLQDNAFKGCTGITTVTLGSKLSTISSTAFGDITFYDEDGTVLEVTQDNYGKLKGYVFEGPNGQLTKVDKTDEDIPDDPGEGGGIDIWMVATPIAFVLGAVLAYFIARRSTRN